MYLVAVGLIFGFTNSYVFVLFKNVFDFVRFGSTFFVNFIGDYYYVSL